MPCYVWKINELGEKLDKERVVDRDATNTGQPTIFWIPGEVRNGGCK